MLVLAIITIVSASSGGYFYYSSLKKTAFSQLERKAYTQLKVAQKNVTSFLASNIKPVRTLAGMPEIKAVLSNPSQSAISNANLVLDHFTTTLEADVSYLMANDGTTLASSNRGSADSFVGQNFSFRPYFRKSSKGASSTYLALGTTSKKRGVYCSYPVFAQAAPEIVGVAIIKASIEKIEQELILTDGEIILLTSPDGVIFISTKSEWLFNLISEIELFEFNKLNSKFTTNRLNINKLFLK